MNSVPKILVRASALALGVASIGGLCLLTACGQKGNLYLPDDPDFKQRATLPDIVRRQFPDMPPARAPGAPANTPPPTPAPSSNATTPPAESTGNSTTPR